MDLALERGSIQSLSSLLDGNGQSHTAAMSQHPVMALISIQEVIIQEDGQLILREAAAEGSQASGSRCACAVLSGGQEALQGEEGFTPDFV